MEPASKLNIFTEEIKEFSSSLDKYEKTNELPNKEELEKIEGFFENNQNRELVPMSGNKEVEKYLKDISFKLERYSKNKEGEEAKYSFRLSKRIGSLADTVFLPRDLFGKLLKEERIIDKLLSNLTKSH